MEMVAPWSLLALLAIPVMVLLHLVRPDRKTVRIASNALWREVLEEHRARLGWARLISNLSLVMLMLFALVSGLALAELQWVTRAVSGYDAVVIIDVSASMAARSGTTSRFARAVTQARYLIDELPPKGRMLLMTSGALPQLRSSFETDARALHRVLAGIVVTDETGRPLAALELARTLLTERERGRIYFITDRAFTVDKVFALEQLQLIDVGGEQSNVAITRFDLRPQISTAERYQVLVTAANFGDQTVRVPLRVTLEGDTLIERELMLNAGASEPIIASFIGKPEGIARAQLVVDDGLAADNHGYAVMERQRGRLVALFSKGNFYLESVLRALPNVVVTPIHSLEPEAFATHVQWNDLVIIDGFVPPPLPAGRFLVFGSPPPAIGIEPQGMVERVRVAGSGDSPLVDGIDFSGVRIDRAVQVALSEPQFRGLKAGALQRLFWSQETALALSFIDSQRRLVWLGFNPVESNFPVQAAYPLFITNALAWLAPAPTVTGATQVQAGARHVVQVPPSVAEVVVKTPGGALSRLKVVRGEVVIENTAKAGIYQVAVGAEERSLAVNLTSAAESDLAPRADFGNGAEVYKPYQRGEDEPDGALAERSVALWPWLVIAALVLLLAEWFLVGARQLHA